MANQILNNMWWWHTNSGRGA